MRFRLSLAALVALTVPVGAMTVVAACGNGDNNGMPDATPDVTTMKDNSAPDVTPDVTPDVAPEASCPDVNIAQYLSNDAGFDVDAGGFALGACFDCFTSKCSSQITACSMDCSCENGVISTVECVIASPSSYETCFLTAISSGDMKEQNLIGCAASNCVTACAPGGGDASVDAPGDGG